MMVGDPRQIDHVRPVPAARQSNVGLARFARPVDDTAEHRKRHRRLDMLEPIFERLDGADHVETLASAARARDDSDSAAADPERFQYLVADADFLFRLGRYRNADRVTDTRPEQVADADRRLHRPADQ